MKKIFTKIQNHWLPIVLFCLLLGNVYFLKYNAFRCFNMLDMGGFLDASWRVYRGQIPYIDFLYYAGPLHLYMNAFFFSLFGFSKTAIVAHLITVHSLVIIGVFTMMYRRLPAGIVLLVILLTIPSFYWNVSHPWHDQSAHFWGLGGVLLLVQQIFLPSRKIVWTGLFCAILGILSVMTKTNLGVGYYGLFFFVLCFFAQRKSALKGFAIGTGVGLFVALLLIRHPLIYFQQAVVDNHALMNVRLTRSLDPRNWLVNGYWIMPALIALLAFQWRAWIFREKELLALFFGFSILGIYSVLTGGVMNETNIFLWGPQMALAGMVIWRIPDVPLLFRRSIQGLYVLLISFFLAIAVRDGIHLKTWSYDGPYYKGDYPLRGTAFAGWKFMSFHGAPLDNLVEYITTHIPKSESLLNLTDMYIIYSLTGRDSYRGITCTVIDGYIPNPGHQVVQMRNNILAHPPDWIIVRSDSYEVELKYLDLQEEILKNYQLKLRAGVYYLLQRKIRFVD